MLAADFGALANDRFEVLPVVGHHRPTLRLGYLEDVLKGERLERRISALEQSASTPSTGTEVSKSLANWAYEVLLDEGGAMPYREIAAIIKSRGFQHARQPKNPDRQLSDSVWSAMYEDERFTKVGRGIFDLTDRQPDAG